MLSEHSNLDIGRELGAIHAKLDQLTKHSSRLMFSMLGIIAATVGVRFINSPPWTIFFAYASLFAAIFLLATVVFQWRQINWPRRLVRLCFTAFMLFSVLIRIFVFESGVVKAPVWYAPAIDMFFVILGIMLVLSAWKDRNY